MHPHRIVAVALFAAEALLSLDTASAQTTRGPTKGSKALNQNQAGTTFRRADAVLAWNAVLLQGNANDFDPAVVSPPDQKGPGRTARAFAIVHAAIFDAVNSIDGSYSPYMARVHASRSEERRVGRGRTSCAEP